MESFWYQYWIDVAVVYSRRSLTKTSDKLIAISGVARVLASKLGVPDRDYLEGL
jgi:hypothetical protein